jgi:hypothetical protein
MIRMIGSKRNLAVSVVCMALFLVAFSALHAHAKAASHPSSTDPQSPSVQTVDWDDGTITRAPYLDSVTRSMMISIDSKEYLLSPTVTVSETGIDGMSVFYEKAVNTGALRQGQRVSFKVVNDVNKTVVRIVINSISHGN